MPFALDGQPTLSEIAEAVNYLLGNFSINVTADPNTGQVTGPDGTVVSYLYKYLAVKYADSFDGSVNFSNTQTNRQYYGLRNSNSSVESTNPADYLWTKVTGGFGTTKSFYYAVTGGRQISYVVSTSAPSSLYVFDNGSSIDLDVISGSDGSSARICYAKTTASSLSSIPATYQTTGNNSFPPPNTWGGSETWQATPPSLAANEYLFQSDGIYNPVTNLTTWNSPYLSSLKVGQLSAISADLGTITAGSMSAVSMTASTITGSDLSIGSSPAISGTTMTGSGAHIYNSGNFAFGNSSQNITWNGSALTINGDIVAYGNMNGTAVGQIIAGSFNFVAFTSVGTTTFTVPSYVYKLKITLIGGGGGGGGSIGGAGTEGGGGGGGGALIKILTVTPGQTYSITVGGGGSVGSQASGGSGGNSTFSGNGTSLIAYGGGGGSAYGGGGGGGGASGGLLNITGANGASVVYLGTGGSAGGGIGGSAAFIGVTPANGQSGSPNSGSGGGGSNYGGSYTGGAGGSGLCIVEY